MSLRRCASSVLSSAICVSATSLPYAAARTAHARLGELGLPVTILRPMAFMELMTDKAYFPAASTWHVMPKLMGENRPVG